MKNELWHAIAGGLLNTWLAELVAITNIDTRQVLELKSVWPNWLRVKSIGAMGYTASDNTIGLLYDEIPDRIYDIAIRDQVTVGKPPLVENASVSGGNTLVCDAPGSGYETHVFSWNSGTREFELVGELSTNNQPGAGYYILVNTFEADPGKVYGLPCGEFLQLTS